MVPGRPLPPRTAAPVAPGDREDVAGQVGGPRGLRFGPHWGPGGEALLSLWEASFVPGPQPRPLFSRLWEKLRAAPRALQAPGISVVVHRVSPGADIMGNVFP